MDAEQRRRAFDVVDRATELPMLVLSLLLVPIIVVPIVVTIPPAWEFAWESVGWVIWAAFALELTVKTFLAPRRLHHLRTHWFDVVIVFVPFLRAVRIFYALRALQLLRLAGLAAKVGELIRDLFGRRGMPYALLVGGILILSSTIAVTIAERGHGGTIDNFGTALWWAVVTATTVGYGDVAPVTPAGRGIAVFVMCVGITLFGLFTANVAAFLLQSGGNTDGRKEVTLGEIAEQLRRLEAQVSDMRELLARQGVAAPPLASNGVEESAVEVVSAGTSQ